MNFRTWMGRGFINPAERAETQAQRIEDKPTDLVLLRGGVKLASQRVRVEMDNRPGQTESEAGRASEWRGVIFGLQHHATRPDTDIRKGDTFVLDEQEFRILGVNRQMYGQVQATVEAVG